MDEQKQAAFLKKAEENKRNFELHGSLIATHVIPKGELEKSSIKHFLEHGKPTGGFLLKLMAYAEAYHGEKLKQDLKLMAEAIQMNRNFIRSEHKSSAHNKFFENWEHKEEFEQLLERIFPDDSKIIEI